MAQLVEFGVARHPDQVPAFSFGPFLDHLEHGGHGLQHRVFLRLPF